ncbi:hypothetical protein PTSG_07701 [Salpingoeca rosetta]|uniref:Uncharacterized protein n=1 Tax=Salpingoeca rosetta (strain ATCC 50818 / BSB-021) TaxID=946362 RepID=F2UHI6_SALR5|nr:uncharacterized protein PTSG_07701 [Salpingoeca rosetta]EGD76585.1 hypothetical protein PTSG_07701 [Salpingoeca rosetta]|eukprot:XP_004991499.1 hypothetical protein PTSG_07701 [Salpingoeca rosetta]
MQDEAESVEQLAHDNAQLRSRLEALEQAYDELEEANEQQFKHIDALKKEKRDLEALCQRRKADMEDMVALQEHCSSLERQLRETKSALQGARSELRKASFQLQLRNARNASVSSRTSTTEGTSSSISSMSQSRSRTFNTARDVLKARRKLLQKLKSADDTDIPPPSPPPQAGPIQAGPATTAAAATAVAAGDVQERIDAAVAAVACAYEKRIASLQDALDEEMQRRKDLQLAHDHAITADAGTAGDHAGDATHGGGDADTSGSGLNLAEELSRVASSDVPLPVGADLTQATQASSHTDATTPRAASTSEAATASEDDSTSGADAKNAGTNSGDARASSGDKTDGASSGSSNSTTTCAGDGGDGDGGGGRRIVLPVSAALTTELRGETQYFGRSDEQTDETLQQQIIMELESEVAELREELESALQGARSELRKASFQLQLRNARNASVSSRTSTTEGTSSSISSMSQSRSRTFNTYDQQ